MNFKPGIYIAIILSVGIHTVSIAQVNTSSKTTIQADTSDTEDGNEGLESIVDVQYRNSGASHRATEATFKSTRIINGQSIENVPGGVLEFRITHHFGEFKQGAETFFGIDNASTRIGLNYGISDRIMVGAGRSTFQKEYDGFVKMKLLRQTMDNRKPLSVSILCASSLQTLPANVLVPNLNTYYFRDRLYFTSQLLIARKFNYRLSLQLMPSYIHYNIVPTSGEPNDEVAIGAGGRLKVSNRIALTAEYFYRLPAYCLKGYKNSLSIGMDVETGGHVFQLFLTNSAGITERNFIEQTSSDWGNGGIRFGFNLSRVFTVRKHR